MIQARANSGSVKADLQRSHCRLLEEMSRGHAGLAQRDKYNHYCKSNSCTNTWFLLLDYCIIKGWLVLSSNFEGCSIHVEFSVFRETKHVTFGELKLERYLQINGSIYLLLRLSPRPIPDTDIRAYRKMFKIAQVIDVYRNGRKDASKTSGPCIIASPS